MCCQCCDMYVRANVNQNIKAQACGNYDYFEGKEVEERRQREAKRMDDMFHREDDDRFLRHVNFIFQYFRRTHNSRQLCIRFAKISKGTVFINYR